MSQSSTPTIDTNEIQRPWTGDLDGMKERRTFRVLTIHGKTFYVAGRGDMAASNLTITQARQALVDCSVPGYTNSSEVILSGKRRSRHGIGVQSSEEER